MNDTKNHIIALSYAGVLFLIVLSILAITATSFISKKGHNDTKNTITVSGTADVFSAPDIAQFSFTVTETAQTTADAQDVISEKVEQILTELEALGIDDKDISTQSYSMYPKYEWGTLTRTEEITPDGTLYYPRPDRQVQVGFDVSQNVSVKVRDFDTIPGVLSLLGQVGVKNMYGPNFEIDEPDSLQEEARAQAIAQAQEKAQRLAKDLGVRLGDLISFNEGNYPFSYARGAELSVMSSDGVSDKASSPMIPAGENTVSSQVTLVYIIK